VGQLDIRELGCPCDLPPVSQSGGLGFLDTILGLAEKVAEPAAVAYATYVQDKQSRQDYRVRRAETAAQLEVRRTEAELEARQAELDAPTKAARAEQLGDVVKLAVGGAVVVAAGLVGFRVFKAAVEALKR
jgi:hypothetical protein